MAVLLAEFAGAVPPTQVVPVAQFPAAVVLKVLPANKFSNLPKFMVMNTTRPITAVIAIAHIAYTKVGFAFCF